MSCSSRYEFLKTWFPSAADHPDPSVFFHNYNAFLNATPMGKRGVLADKILLAAALQNGGVRTPVTLLTLGGGRYFTPQSDELTEAQAVSLLKGREAFIKSRHGWGGAGAFRLLADGSVQKANGDRIGKRLPRLLSSISGQDYIVQEMIEQDERFSRVAPASINTVRCVTFRAPSGRVDIAAATWRIGDGRSVVDNGSSGGIVCCIDPATGRITGPGRTLAGSSHETHPFSGFHFDGAEVPGIVEIFETARKAHRAFNAVASAGWDVAMTPGGPLVIEGNDPWGARGHALVDSDFVDRTWKLFMRERRVAGSGFPAARRRIDRLGMVKATLSIRGKVQGVGYRKWVSNYAADRGVRADPRNLDDGTVLCELIGQRWRVEFVVFACHRGPPAAEVESVDVTRLRSL